MRIEDTTHQIEIEVKFDSSLISREEIEGIISRRRKNLKESEVIECGFKDDDLLEIVVYISKNFISKSWDTELVKFYAEEYLGDLMFPRGIKKSDVRVREVEKLK